MALTDSDKQALAAIARAGLAAAVRGEAHAPADPGLPGLLERRGCFVTLKTNGRLRGCLGCFTTELPLYRAVADYTRFSALEDPRFQGRRIREKELPATEIDISCLTPLAPCAEPERITLGVHGIYVRSGGRAGCFLPQVAAETGWSVEAFWSHCCADKAGLSPDAWRRPETECLVFTADVFAFPACPA